MVDWLALLLYIERILAFSLNSERELSLLKFFSDCSFSPDMWVSTLALCCRVTYIDMIVILYIIARSRISMFSYTMSCTCVCQLVWLTYCFKVIDSLMQDVWVSSYKQTDHF